MTDAKPALVARLVARWSTELRVEGSTPGQGPRQRGGWRGLIISYARCIHEGCSAVGVVCRDFGAPSRGKIIRSPTHGVAPSHSCFVTLNLNQSIN